MSLVVFEPADAPSLDQQLDALSKGLGRAVSWAKSGRLDEESLLATCLRDCQYDAQLEGNRGDWLWGMVETVGAVDRFREPIIAALTNLSETWTANQLCVLARHYVQDGDEPFRERLRAIVRDKPVEECPWLGESELLQVDGDAGFLFAVRVRGQFLAANEWHSDDASFVRFAAQQIGAERVDRLLAEAADEAVVRFARAWRDHEASETERKQSRSDRRKPPAESVEEVIRAAETEDEAFRLRRWGRSAEELDLRTVVERLWTAREPRMIANLLRVFSARALPEFEPRLIELCRHDDPDVRRAAYVALGQNAHPQIRAFALSEIEHGSFEDRPVIALLARNFQPGDEALILAAFRDPADANDRHWLLMDVLEVLQTNPTADSSRLGLLVYALTPCENCRADAVQILLDQGAAPDWLRDECRYDASEECRKLVASDPTAS